MTFDEQAATMDHKSVAALLASHQQLAARIEQLMRQLEWFKRQMFGSRSERRLVDVDARQLYLGEWSQAESETRPVITVAAHQRSSLRLQEDETQGDGELRFDASVPVEEIRLPSPVLDAEHEVISEKVTYRLAQRPVSYVVLKYIRPVVKRKDDGSLISAPVPGTVLGKSLADVSLLACMAVDKFRYHRVPRRHAQHPKGRRSKPCCMEDEGGPLGIGVQAQVPNHFELLGSRVRVVNVEGKGAA